MLSGEATHTNFIVFDLADWGSNPQYTIFEVHANHYTTDTWKGHVFLLFNDMFIHVVFLMFIEMFVQLLLQGYTFQVSQLETLWVEAPTGGKLE
jgi:hypothetical protein